MAVNEVKDAVIFLRKLIAGPADKSYGIYCAEIAGLPEKIISRANQLLSEMTLGEAQAPLLVVQETASAQAEQLDLFGELEEKPKKRSKGYGKEDKIIAKLKEADLINMTPLEAMNFLFALKKQL